jgi:hypothetical protein
LGARDLCSNHGRPNTKEKEVGSFDSTGMGVRNNLKLGGLRPRGLGSKSRQTQQTRKEKEVQGPLWPLLQAFFNTSANSCSLILCPSLFMGCGIYYLTKMEPMVILFIIALTVVLFVYLFFNTFKRFIINSVVCIALIFLLNLVFGLNMAINWFTIAAVALFGLPAVGTLLILYLGGMLL